MIKKTAKESMERLIKQKRQVYEEARKNVTPCREVLNNISTTIQILDDVKFCLFEDSHQIEDIKKTAKESMERLIKQKLKEYDERFSNYYSEQNFQCTLITIQVLNDLKLCLFEDIETLFVTENSIKIYNFK